MQKKEYLSKAMDWVKSKSTYTVRAKAEGFEDTKIFTNKSSEETIQPDISYITNRGNKHFTEIAMKSDKPQKLITRWKLLSTMASLKNGKLHLLAPRGHKMFTQRLVDKYNIRAKVYSL
jgi:hypothetical protein